jgi:diaminopimelate epimerase
MIVAFTKAAACGNDFLIVDGSFAPGDIWELTRRMCDRHNGIGADGVEWLFPVESGDADVHARLINADGSEAEISGNGTRCVAAYLCAEHGRETFRIRTGAGVKTCALTARAGTRYDFEIAMGQPNVGPELVIRSSFGETHGIAVSMGNPHYVVFVPEFPPGWQARAAEIQGDPSFPQGVNVEFVRVHEPHHLEVRFYERGVGETQSSGTGSSASAAAAIASRRAQSPLRIETPGGLQVVRWEEELFLRGSAELICRGEFFS